MQFLSQRLSLLAREDSEAVVGLTRDLLVSFSLMANR